MASYRYVAANGVIVPDTADTLAEVTAEFEAALGVDIIVDPSTPEGALIVAETAARTAVIENNAELANQINPDYAGGLFLDDLMALTGSNRQLATASTAVCTVTGVSGTIIGTEVTFRSTNGYYWRNTAVYTMSGTTDSITVRCTEAGAIGAGAGQINYIYVGTVGLETVTNPAAATVGSLTQSDQQARLARKNLLGVQGVNLSQSIISALYALPGVKGVQFRENRAGTTQTIDGIIMVRNSIYACIDGGDQQSIAETLLLKTAGVAFNGPIEITATDPYSGQDYLVKFDAPEYLSVFIKVTCKATNPLINPQIAVRDAIMIYATGGLTGEEGFALGASVSPFEIGGAVTTLYPTIYVKKVEAKLAIGGSFSTDEIPLAIFQKAVVTESAIEVITY